MHQIGSIVKGKVKKTLPRGAIVTLEEGGQGFVHISEIAEEFVQKVEDYLKEGDIVTCRVIGTDERGRLELSIKRAKQTSSHLEDKLRRFKEQSDDRLSALRKKETSGRGKR